jgi:hypothetical protein
LGSIGFERAPVVRLVVRLYDAQCQGRL